MTDRLAGLVLPDKTPVDEAASQTPDKRKWRLKRPAAQKAPKQASPRRRPRERKAGSLSAGDVAIVGTGLALAFVCAIFPWYIFFNKDEFGTRAISFGERTSPIPAADMTASADSPLAGRRLPFPADAFPALDMAATGTVSSGGNHAAPDTSDQPFPGEKPNYQLVLVANGRAMIADKDGYWVVEPGSWLPDGSRVKALDKRDGRWVLVNSNEAVIPLSE